MSWGYYNWRPYVPVAQRRAKAARELAKLSKKNGHAASPVVLNGRRIAATFWGKAWCDNLEAYSDYENRLPRGRTYVRNGSVVDLQIATGKVSARVSGSELYEVEIKIKPLAPALWKSIQTDCAGGIDSLIELLQGKLSAAVMHVVTRPERGLFPAPREITMDCSCPDWAGLCKHVAAVLYGVGARLDQNPGLLFLLRGVDAADLISKASAADAVRQTRTVGAAPAMSEAEAADVFGIELASATPLATPAHEDVVAPGISRPEPMTAPARRRPRLSRKMSATMRAKIAAAARRRWARLKQQDVRARTARTAAKPNRRARPRRSSNI